MRTRSLDWKGQPAFLKKSWLKMATDVTTWCSGYLLSAEKTAYCAAFTWQAWKIIFLKKKKKNSGDLFLSANQSKHFVYIENDKTQAPCAAEATWSQSTPTSWMWFWVYVLQWGYTDLGGLETDDAKHLSTAPPALIFWAGPIWPQAVIWFHLWKYCFVSIEVHTF